MNLVDMSDYRPAAKLYWCFLVTMGALVGGWAFVSCLSFTVEEWTQFVALTIFVVASCYHPIRHPGSTSSFSAGDTFIFLGGIFLGVPAATLLGILDSLMTTVKTSRRAVALIGAPAVMGLTAFASSQAFYLTLEQFSLLDIYPLGVTAVSLEKLFAPIVVMTLAHYFANTWLIASLYAIKKGVSLWEQWREHSWLSVHFFAAGVAATIIYAAVAKFGLVYLLLALPVIIATYAAYHVYFERVNETIRQTNEMARLHLATVEALATAIDAKDQTTHCHVRRLQLYARRMATLLNLSESEVEALKAGSLLHDVGKLAVPDLILNDPGKLSSADFEKMKMHTVVGAQILERVNFPYPVVPIVRHHHEQWDGEGYPDGLRGEQIPVTARLLAVVDCYDSAREERPYRRGMTRAEAVAVLRAGSGTRFDPHIVNLFIENLDRFEAEISAEGLDEGLAIDAEDSARNFARATASSSALAFSPTRQSSPRRQKTPPAPSYLNQIRDAQREVYAFYEIARTFGSSLNLEDTLTLLANKIAHIVPCETCAVYLYDEATSRATVAHAAGKNADALSGHAVTLGRGAIGAVLAERMAMSLTAAEVEFAGEAVGADFAYRAMALVPLIKAERLIGALAIYTTQADAYTGEHMRLLETVARLASDAIANAIRHSEVEANSLTDVLTGLPNARCLYLQFEQEVARARRNNSTFHVIMLDLDDFKQVNDNFGHKVGDRMLLEAAQIMKGQLREYDFLARYAGDEFVAIVQGLVNTQAEELCERFEHGVSKLSFFTRPDKVARVGLSAGSAIYGVDGETMDELLMAADHAMYRIKASHKQEKLRLVEGANPDEIPTENLASQAIS